MIDLTAQGFTLIGGRLDYIDGKPVAAIVYRRRVHVINLFVGPGSGRGRAHAQARDRAGLQHPALERAGLNLLAVSDLGREELEEFGDKFDAAARAERAG